MGFNSLGIGAMVGTGIFTITGTAAATLGGSCPSCCIYRNFSYICVSLIGALQNLLQIQQLVGYILFICGFGRISSLDSWLTIAEFMTAVSGVATGWAAYFKGFA